MNLTVRSYLIEIARKGKTVTYSTLNQDCKLGLSGSWGGYERDYIGGILGEIARFEFREGRPLLSAVTVSEGSNQSGKFTQQGDGFFRMCEELEIWRFDKSTNFEFGMQKLAECHEFWRDESNYLNFKDAVGILSLSAKEEKTDQQVTQKEEIKNKLIRREISLLPKNQPERSFAFEGIEVDFIEQAIENKKLGDAGESLVLQFEKDFLTKNGRPDLAERVEKVLDGKGFDIRSFTLTGSEKFIEVKTTTHNFSKPFKMSRTEVEFMKKNLENYFLYRVFSYNFELNSGEFFERKGDLNQFFNFEPSEFWVS